MIDNRHSKAHAQLIAVCMFSKSTGKVEYDNFEKYYAREGLVFFYNFILLLQPHSGGAILGIGVMVST